MTRSNLHLTTLARILTMSGGWFSLGGAATHARPLAHQEGKPGG